MSRVILVPFFRKRGPLTSGVKMTTLRDASFDRILAQDVYPFPDRWNGSMARQFRGLDLDSARILDIGGGSGALSFWCAVQGSNVTCLEPLALGSNSDMDSTFERFHAEVKTSFAVDLKRQTFQEFVSADTYDVIVMHNSINHLDEVSCESLRDSTDSRDMYTSLFKKAADLMNPGGTLIASDCARLNLFGQLGIRNPFSPDIEWHIHQQPSAWVSLLLEAGFVNPEIHWNPMNRTGSLGRLLFANALGAYLTTSHFTIRVQTMSR